MKRFTDLTRLHQYFCDYEDYGIEDTFHNDLVFIPCVECSLLPLHDGLQKLIEYHRQRNIQKLLDFSGCVDSDL